MELIVDFINRMLPYMLGAIPAAVIWRSIAFYILKNSGRKTTIYHEIGLIVFAVFCAGLFSQTIIPNDAVFVWDNFNINFKLFKVIDTAYKDITYNGSYGYFLISIAGNIVMFIPFGLFIPLLYKRSFVNTILIGACVSVFIEICQLPLSRWTDIDDIWLNTLGVFAGYLIYMLIRKLAPSVLAKFLVKNE